MLLILMSPAASADAPSDSSANYFFVKTLENTVDSIEITNSMYYSASELDSYLTQRSEWAHVRLTCVHS